MDKGRRRPRKFHMDCGARLRAVFKARQSKFRLGVDGKWEVL